MGCVPTHATPTCCAGWGCRSPSNLSAGRKVGRLTILPFLAQGPSMLSVPDPHKHFFKDIGEEMARRRPGLDLLVRSLLLHTRPPLGFSTCERFEAGFLATKIQLRCRMVRDGGRGAQKRSTMPVDRKSTRLNSSHQIISYAVFC